MLEHPILVLCPPDSKGHSPIIDAADQPVGFVCSRPREGIWRWLGRPVLEIHEGEEAPLLFTIHTRWGLPRRHEVRDAEDYDVGTLLGRFVINEFGRRLAEFHSPYSLVNQKGEILATLIPEGDNLRVAFQVEAERDPFLKMLLLAAAILRT